MEERFRLRLNISYMRQHSRCKTAARTTRMDKSASDGFYYNTEHEDCDTDDEVEESQCRRRHDRGHLKETDN